MPMAALSRTLLIALAATATAQGMSMGGMGGGEDEVETHNAEELTAETLDDRIADTELVRESLGQTACVFSCCFAAPLRILVCWPIS